MSVMGIGAVMAPRYSISNRDSKHGCSPEPQVSSIGEMRVN